MEVSEPLNREFFTAIETLKQLPARLSEAELRAIGIFRLCGMLQNFSDFRLLRLHETEEKMDRFIQVFTAKHEAVSRSLKLNDTSPVESDVQRFINSTKAKSMNKSKSTRFNEFVEKQLCDLFLRVEVELWKQAIKVLQGQPDSEAEDSYLSQSDFLSSLPATKKDNSSPDESSPGTKLFSADTKWSDVTFTIISNETIRVSIRDNSRPFHYAEMGFLDKRKGDQPTSLWGILINVFGKNKGRVSWENANSPSKQQQDQLKKSVGRIRTAMREFSGLSEDPFHGYKKSKAYELKAKLIDKRLGAGEISQAIAPAIWGEGSTVKFRGASRIEQEQMTQDFLDSAGIDRDHW